MKKLFLSLVLIVLLAVGGGVYYVLTNLNYLVETAIEKYGSEALKTSVQVASVDIRLTEAQSAINGLTISNPAGFDSIPAFSMDNIALGVNIKEAGQDQIGIDFIRIHGPEVYFEINAAKKANLNVLKENLLASSGSATSAEDNSQSQGDKQQPILHIKEFVFAEAKLKAKVVPLDNKDYALTLPNLVLRNLKGTPQQISQQVLQQLIDHAKTEVKRKGIDAELDKAKRKVKQKVEQEKAKLKSKADEKLEQEKQKVEDKLKGLFK